MQTQYGNSKNRFQYSGLSILTLHVELTMYVLFLLLSLLFTTYLSIGNGYWS